MTTWIFYCGLAIDAIVLLLALSNIGVMTSSTLGGIDGIDGVPADGLSDVGRIALWVIPLLLLALIGAAARLKSRGAVRTASLLLWVPALPFLLAMLMWGGLAVVFVLFGR